MRSTFISFLFSLLVLHLNAFNRDKDFLAGKDIFGTRIFIENKGQFDGAISGTAPVKFALLNGDEDIFFTPKGLVYKYTKRYAISERKREQLEEGKNVKLKQDVNYYISMSWKNANPNIEMIESGKQDRYFTYGTKEYNSYVYKKITYKNVYNGIDIEYTIPEDKEYGIKYNVIVHPGANANDVKIVYSGDTKSIYKNKAGEVVIEAEFGEDIVEHLPVSYYDDKTPVASSFNLNNDEIFFSFAGHLNNTKTLTIDPWVTNVTSLATNNFAYDVDYDFAGNLFVYGGAVPFYTAKYNAAGVLQWTFGGIVVTPSWNGGGGTNYVSNFCVNRNTGKAYIGQGWVPAGGTRVIRLDVLGNYDSFISAAVPNWQEIWDMGFQCSTGNVFGLGGCPAANFSCGSINQTSGAVVATSFMPGNPASSQDIASYAMDDAGNPFVYYTSSNVSFLNTIARVNTAMTNSVWVVPSTYAVMNYCFTKGNYVGSAGVLSNGFNCLAVNMNYLFFFDGLDLAAYNKTTGAKIASIVVPGLSLRQSGGIDVDDCNNVYIGGNGSVLCYNFTGTAFNSLAAIPLGTASANKYVFDIKLDRPTNILYVAGSGFCGTYSALHSLACISNQYSVTTSCVGGAGTAVASVTTTIPAPLMNYIWTNGTGTVSSTINTPAFTNTVSGLANGIYSVSIQINAPCGPLYTTTVNISCLCSATVAVATACPPGGSTTSLSVTATSGFTSTPSYTWTGPGTFSSTVQNPNFLNGGFYGTYTLTASTAGCTFTTTVNSIPVSSFTPGVVSQSVTCNGLNNGIGTTTIVGGSAPFTYTWTSTPVQNTSVANNLPPGIYTVTVKDNMGCIFTATTQIVQPPALTLTINSSAPLTCVNSTLGLTGTTSGGVGPYNYTWTAGPTANTQTVSQTTSGAYVYTLSSTDANNCPINNSVTLTWVPNPTVTVASVSVCAGTTATLTALGATNYTWSPGFATGSTFTVNPVGNITYNILGASGTCTSNTTANITVNPLPLPNIVSNAPVCIGQQITFTGSGGVGYSWSGAGGFNSTAQNPNIPVSAMSNNGNVNLTVTDVNGCMASTSQMVVVNPLPNAMATGTTVCINANANLNASGGNNYSWTGPNGFSSNAQNPTIFSITAAAAGQYTVLVTSAAGCANTAFATLGAQPAPTPSVISNNPICLGDILALSASGGITYSWTGPNGFFSTAQSPTVLANSASYTGNYSVTATDAIGCFGSTGVSVNVNSLPTANIISSSNTGCAPLCVTFTCTSSSPSVTVDWMMGEGSYQNANASSQACYGSVGVYTITANVTDQNGCRNSTTYTVHPFPKPIADFNYAPIKPVVNQDADVHFTDASYGATIASWNWYFMNNASATSGSQNPVFVYENAGAYAVALVVKSDHGCMDTIVQSVLVGEDFGIWVPNAFTPNADGLNDQFYAKGFGITKYEMNVFDRWGEKVFTSTDINEAWDGTVSAKGTKTIKDGVYDWIIRVTNVYGKSKEYTGHVTLIK